MKVCFTMLFFFAVASLHAQVSGEQLKSASSAMQSQDYQGAITLYRKVLDTDPKNMEALYNSGQCYLGLKNLDSAKLMFENAVRVAPDYANIYLNLGTIYSQQENYQKGIENYTEFIRRDSTNLGVYFNRSVGYLYSKRLGEAYKDAVRVKTMGGSNERVAGQIDAILKILGDRNPSTKCKEFTDSKNIVTCTLPETWHARTEGDDKTMQLFISAEKIDKLTDLFTIGASIILINRVSKTIPELEDKDPEFVTDFWDVLSEKGGLFGLFGYEKYFFKKEISRVNFTSGNFKGKKIIRELQRFDNSYRLKSMELITSYDDKVFTVVFEAPANEFEAYLPVFEKAASSLRVSLK
ncbi:MAG: tetratricopeptide repeat protein [Ignavibacteria bacterium]|nr:tetratricopeptide repeat protein [Ignavibacteria bacterium]